MDYLDTRIYVRKVIAYLSTVICRPIIYKNQNELTICLR